MFRYTPYALSLVLLQPLMVNAQGVTNAQIEQVHQSIHSSIKGTLDGVARMPRLVQNNARQFVFPRSLNNAFGTNPWSQTPLQPRVARQQGYNGVPKGNPWAPLGDTQNIPFDRTNMMGFEKNPYNDSGIPRQLSNRQSAQSPGLFNSAYSINQRQVSPFGHDFSNRAFDASNGSFSSPFNSGFFPSNQFWPGGNNANGNFPFMPW